MSKFLKEVQKNIRENEQYGEFQDQYMYSSGLTLFDYMNGNMEASKAGTKPRYNLGLDGGKIVTIIGRSGTGKSTLAVQMGAEIINRYENGVMMIFDYENAHSYNRIKTVTGMSDEDVERKIDIRQSGISTETVLEAAIQLRDLKLKNKKDLMVKAEHGQIDRKTGEPLYVLEPSVIIADSVAMMMPREDLSKGMEKADMGSNMSAAHAAKANTQLMRRLVQVLREGNIIMIFINHIQQKINTGFMPQPADLQYLKQDESLPGGTAVQYLANTLIKLTTGKKLHADKTYQIHGSEVNFELIKSRTAPAGTVGKFIFEPAIGFQDELTLLQFLIDEGYRKGSPVSYYLDGLEDYKFRLSNFREVLKENPEFEEKFRALAIDVLKSKYRNTEYGEAEEVKELTDEELAEIDKEAIEESDDELTETFEAE